MQSVLAGQHLSAEQRQRISKTFSKKLHRLFVTDDLESEGECYYRGDFNCRLNLPLDDGLMIMIKRK